MAALKKGQWPVGLRLARRETEPLSFDGRDQTSQSYLAEIASLFYFFRGSVLAELIGIAMVMSFSDACRREASEVQGRGGHLPVAARHMDWRFVAVNMAGRTCSSGHDQQASLLSIAKGVQKRSIIPADSSILRIAAMILPHMHRAMARNPAQSVATAWCFVATAKSDMTLTV